MHQADGAQYAPSDVDFGGHGVSGKVPGNFKFGRGCRDRHRATLRGSIRIGLPLHFGLKRLVPLLFDFARRYPEMSLDMDFSDRRAHLIEEGIDLSIRITGRLEGGDVARKIGSCSIRVVASPDYLARCGRPQHPSELARHECLGYTIQGNQQHWQFEVDGVPKGFPVKARTHANNGKKLMQAAAQGLGDYLSAGFHCR